MNLRTSSTFLDRAVSEMALILSGALWSAFDRDCYATWKIRKTQGI